MSSSILLYRAQISKSRHRPYLTLNILETVRDIQTYSGMESVWLSGNALASINVVVLRQTRLISGWVTVWTGKPSRYVTSQLGRLSLLPSVGR